MTEGYGVICTVLMISGSLRAGRRAVLPDGLIHDPALREHVVDALSALAEHLRTRGD
ncbi:MAG: hypothetical protein ACRDN9_08875 [Streptosporangiaceae bacterium]